MNIRRHLTKKVRFLIFLFIFVCGVFIVFVTIKCEVGDGDGGKARGEDVFEIYFLDVGQGDSIYINYNDFDILIDGGPKNSINYYLGRLFFPFCSIDGLFLTHPHSDHLGGLTTVLDRCSVKYIFQSKYNTQKNSYTSLYTSWLQKIEDANIKIDFVHKGDLIEINKNISVKYRKENKGKLDSNNFSDGLRIYVLWPPEGEVDRLAENLNNTSVVLFVDYLDFEAFLLADAEKEVQDFLEIDKISSYIEWPVEVLKIAHHGSKDGFNKDFYNKIKPENAIISVGKNSYGHPHGSVIKFLESQDTNILRTDVDGTIKFKKVKQGKKSCLYSPISLLFEYGYKRAYKR